MHIRDVTHTYTHKVQHR